MLLVISFMIITIINNRKWQYIHWIYKVYLEHLHYFQWIHNWMNVEKCCSNLLKKIIGINQGDFRLVWFSVTAISQCELSHVINLKTICGKIKLILFSQKKKKNYICIVKAVRILQFSIYLQISLKSKKSMQIKVI